MKVMPEDYDYNQELARAAFADMLHDSERNQLYRYWMINLLVLSEIVKWTRQDFQGGNFCCSSVCWTEISGEKVITEFELEV